MKLYAWLKTVLKRFRAIPNYCRDCGRAAEPFKVPDPIWLYVAPSGDHILCLRDFTRRAARLKIHVEWRGGVPWSEIYPWMLHGHATDLTPQIFRQLYVSEWPQREEQAKP